MASTSNSNSSRSNQPSRKRRSGGAGRVFAVIGKVLGTLVLVGVITCAILACFAAVYIKTVIMPDAGLDLKSFDTKLSSTIYYTDKTTGQPVELQTLHGDENRVWVSFDEIPDYLKEATVAIEDKRFYSHHGVDWLRTAKGVLSMFTGGDIQGGSTITQQLIKNMTKDNEVTVRRKIQEIFRALEVDKNYSKDLILEYYLNYIFLGHKCSGVATGAMYYFNKDVSELDLAECAVLISITNNPSMYDPFTYPENSQMRATLVLNAMLAQEKISQAEYDEAMARIADVPAMLSQGENSTQSAVVYPWYVEEVISDVIDDLMEQYQYSEKMAQDVLYMGGLSIYTCLDPDVQAAVDKVYSTQESMPLVSDSGQKLQSAIVVIDTQGNVVALAGALGEKTLSRGYNMARDAHRQPGSSIKMLSAYGPALDMGLITPYSVFDDSPVMSLGGKAWPSNSDYYYMGRETVYNAVERSSNTVAARVVEMLSPEASFNFLQERFHISGNSLVASGDKNDLGLSQLALGGLTKGVSPLEMAAAYSVFPRYGVYIEPKSYTQVKNPAGEVLLDRTVDTSEQAVKQSTAWYVNTMLKNVVSSGTGTEARLSNMTVAGKTGSTNSYNDRWFVGYTPYYTAAVWTGFETPERIHTTGNPAARLWKQVMSQVHEGLENKDFERPQGMEEPIAKSYCVDSGLLATDACALDPRGSRIKTGYFFASDVPTQNCDLHKEVEVCKDSPILNANGEAISGLYHEAGEYCPREDVEGTDIKASVETIALLDYNRERVNGAKTARDEAYLLENWQSYGPCDVHTSPIEVPPAEYDPYLFNIDDPSTWPTQEQWPGFDADNPATWPTVGPVVTPTPSPGGGEGGAAPNPSPTPAQTPSPPPAETVVPPPESGESGA